ncbi:MAG: fimbiral protein PilA [Myxococcales bacterium]|nr:fimbiral protein PilA [Myxococcales bacterium]
MRRLQRGFTLIELMIVVAIIGILASVAIPSLIKYIRRSKTIEATMNLRKIYDSSVAYYEADHADKSGVAILKQFPTNAGPSPGATATAACCGQSGDRCVPAPTNFASDSWTVLHFSVDDPFFFVYQYSTSGTDTSATFGAWAFGDLDCDSIQSTFERSGSVMPDRSVTGAAGLFSKNENE